MKFKSILTFSTATIGLVLLAGLSGCGNKDSNQRTPADEEFPSGGGGGGGGGGGNKPQPSAGNDDAVLRGRWEITMTAGGEAMQVADVSRGTVSQPMSGIVAAAVTYTVSNTNFSTPAIVDGEVSYGSLDVTALRDNSLRVCGANGTTKCTQAEIRVYSTGTAGPGLYSDTEGYGLPIKTGPGGANLIGLGAANAAVVKQVTISNAMRNLKLSNFIASGALQVPVSVDFTDAAAGSYATTLVVEYVLR